MSVFSINKDEIIIGPIMGPGKVDKYTTKINLKAFYMDLYETFSNNKAIPFQDHLGEPKKKEKGKFFNQAVKKGEQVDNSDLTHLSRAPYLYEKKFTWSKNPGFVEFEIIWQARAPTLYGTNYGWFEIKIDLVNRLMKDVEVLEGNEKKTYQSGLWEFRNEIVYKNNIIPELLNKIPIIKNSPHLKHLYIETMYEKTIEKDVLIVGQTKIKPLIKGVIEKHFG